MGCARANISSSASAAAGVVVSVVAGLFHPGPPANHHVVAFAAYARSTPWIAVHLGQFAGMLLIVGGLAALFLVRRSQRGKPTWLGRFGALAAVLSLAIYAVLQAVDGVALKHAVDAWAAAPDDEKAARFASAERCAGWSGPSAVITVSCSDCRSSYWACGSDRSADCRGQLAM